MSRFDHLTLPVADLERSRDWYMRCLGLRVEFEIVERRTVALQDEHDFTIFFQQVDNLVVSADVALYFQVDDVEGMHAKLGAAGVPFAHPPQRVAWGYGAELSDPDGYVIRLWDQRTMEEKGSTDRSERYD